MEQTEVGVMVMKNGKAWGILYEDGHCTAYGWIEPAKAPIHNPTYCIKPTDVTYEGSPDVRELQTGELVMVERTTIVRIM